VADGELTPCGGMSCVAVELLVWAFLWWNVLCGWVRVLGEVLFTHFS
jgi:hypothetical protein